MTPSGDEDLRDRSISELVSLRGRTAVVVADVVDSMSPIRWP
jgi:hypothetical protein